MLCGDETRASAHMEYLDTNYLINFSMGFVSITVICCHNQSGDRSALLHHSQDKEVAKQASLVMLNTCQNSVATVTQSHMLLFHVGLSSAPVSTFNVNLK